jgi:aryl-alcohol dehydrogenase-like predicted oxidoreductase
VLVTTKGGRGRPADGTWTVTGSPRHLKAAAEASLKRLGVDATCLCQLHKPGPAVPCEEPVGAPREPLDEGGIRPAGISSTDTGLIRRAHAILGDRPVSVRNQYSPAVRDSEPELRFRAEPGPAFLPWSPLGGISHGSLDGPRDPDGEPGFRTFRSAPREHGVRHASTGSAPNTSAWPGCWRSHRP